MNALSLKAESGSGVRASIRQRLKAEATYVVKENQLLQMKESGYM